MQTYAPADAPRAAPVLAAHCGRSAPGSALTCRRSPSSPSRIAPGMRHAPTDAGRIAARRLPGRSLLTRAGLPIHTSAGLALALRLLTARHAACKWRVGHRRRGKPPAGLRCAQRNHASGLRPWVFFPATAAPLPAIRGLRLAAGYRVPAWAARAAASARSKASQGPASYITRNYPQPVGCSAPARIIFVMQNAGPALRAPPALAVGLRRLALRCSFSARPPATRPPPEVAPQVDAGATAICG